ncbi:hypothetical protein VTK73DRAFT_3560 [Phialemonium thermophilum]|uniref:Uncharacterized protein n=1 Tax=Phialemonium thermophilum TaxID=223376 RepID=A0ABR3VK09_9PEZI
MREAFGQRIYQETLGEGDGCELMLLRCSILDFQRTETIWAQRDLGPVGHGLGYTGERNLERACDFFLFFSSFLNRTPVLLPVLLCPSCRWSSDLHCCGARGTKWGPGSRKQGSQGQRRGLSAQSRRARRTGSDGSL